MRVVLVAAVAGLALAGCNKADWGIPPSAEEIAAADTATCTSYGFPVGHPDHGFCRMTLDQQRMLAETARATAAAGNPGLALSGAALLQQSMQPH
ncbi:MAG TPA: hypothetical protein VFO09_05075 [Methyloceanibacter sp.]|nr:hypothetical protein [Methyloceanibacter sp.]